MKLHTTTVAVALGLSLLCGARAQAPLDPTIYAVRPAVDAEISEGAEGKPTLVWSVPSKSASLFAGAHADRRSTRKFVGRVVAAQSFVLPTSDLDSPLYYRIQLSGGSDNGKSLFVGRRFLPMEGAVNFRDLGGYRTGGGKHIKWGKAFRSDGLAKLTDHDLNYLTTKVGLHLVCDLRGESETTPQPDHLPKDGSIRRVNFPIGVDMKVIQAALQNPVPAQDDDAAAAKDYIDLAEERAATVLGPLLKQYADPENYPIVTHCAAGKDRTGVATAILLSLLGVPRETVIGEYTLTNLVIERMLEAENKDLVAQGQKPEVMSPMWLAKKEWIEATLKHIDEKYGSVDNYVITACKLDRATIEKIRANLLE
jgi:protein-tyrosine phosphatase